jgi:hypothetical protein
MPFPIGVVLDFSIPVMLDSSLKNIRFKVRPLVGMDSFWQTIMYDEVIEEGFGSGLCSLVSCWNSYSIPFEMVGYDKDVLIKSCKPKLHIYNNRTK